MLDYPRTEYRERYLLKWYSQTRADVFTRRGRKYLDTIQPHPHRKQFTTTHAEPPIVDRRPGQIARQLLRSYK